MDVRLIAHRGYAIHAPQNSAEAFEAAGRLGFWAIETDVRRTLDGVLVCCHDATVDSMFCGSGEISAQMLLYSPMDLKITKRGTMVA